MWFPEGMGTDTTDEVQVAEFVREKVLLHTREEIPHSVGVICDYFERTKKVVRIHAIIFVERDGQKGIIIGHKGEMIKRIGTDARLDLERLLIPRCSWSWTSRSRRAGVMMLRRFVASGMRLTSNSWRAKDISCICGRPR